MKENPVPLSVCLSLSLASLIIFSIHLSIILKALLAFFGIYVRIQEVDVVAVEEGARMDWNQLLLGGRFGLAHPQE